MLVNYNINSKKAKIIKLFIFTSAFLMIFVILPAFNNPKFFDKSIMKLSLSSDGDYAISTDMGKRAILWDIKKHQHHIIDKNVNIYSAYFVKNSNMFIYQENISNNVYVRNIQGKLIKKIKLSFPSYGEILSTDLSTLIASDVDDQLFVYKNGNQIKQLNYMHCNALDPAPPPGAFSICAGFIGDGKMINLNLSSDDKYLTATDDSDLLIFDLNKLLLNHQINENSGTTYGTISPDNKKIVSGDISGRGFIFDADSGKIIQKPHLIGKDNDDISFCDEAHSLETGHCPVQFADAIMTIKFIDDDHYIVVYNMNAISLDSTYHHVALYSTKNPKIIKYLPLLPKETTNTYWHTTAMWQGKELPQSRYPEIYTWVRDDSLDTAPKVHELVMSQVDDNGILVYKYDPKDQTLNLEWIGNIEPSKWNIFAKLNE